jgi:hypothetical protein
MGTDILFSSRLCFESNDGSEGKHIIEFKFEPEVIQTGVLYNNQRTRYFVIVAGVYYQSKKVVRKLTNDIY